MFGSCVVRVHTNRPGHRGLIFSKYFLVKAVSVTELQCRMAESVGGYFFGCGGIGIVARDICTQGMAPHSYQLILCDLERIVRFKKLRRRAILLMPRGLKISGPWLLINCCSLSIGFSLLLTITAVSIDHAMRVFVLLGGISAERGAFLRVVESNNEASHIG